MKTALIITSFNRPEYLRMCLDSIKNTYLPKGTLIYIIDDCSDNLETVSLINNFKYTGCIVKKIFKDINKGCYDSYITAYEYVFDNNFDYAVLLGADTIVNNYFYDMMMYYKQLFPDRIISGFNTLSLSELNKPRHPVIYNGGFYATKNTNGSAGNLIDKNIWEKYIKPTILGQIKKKRFCYDTISSRKMSDDGLLTINTSPSVIEHIGINSLLGHDVNPDIAYDFEPYIELPKKMKVTFNMATYPRREKELEVLVERLLSIDIVDKIRIYLNEYTECPQFCKHEKIEYIIGEENLKDSGKFYWAGTLKDEYYFSGDDDLAPTKEYFESHIRKLNYHQNKCFVSTHGQVLNPNPSDFRDLAEKHHCLRELREDRLSNFLGTGVMVFDNSKYKIPLSLFKYHGMTDLWIALYCQMNNISCVVRKHAEDELTYLLKHKNTLWNKQKDFRGQHQEILTSLKTWRLIQL